MNELTKQYVRKIARQPRQLDEREKYLLHRELFNRYVLPTDRYGRPQYNEFDLMRSHLSLRIDITKTLKYLLIGASGDEVCSKAQHHQHEDYSHNIINIKDGVLWHLEEIAEQYVWIGYDINSLATLMVQLLATEEDSEYTNFHLLGVPLSLIASGWARCARANLESLKINYDPRQLPVLLSQYNISRFTAATAYYIQTLTKVK